MYGKQRQGDVKTRTQNGVLGRGRARVAPTVHRVNGLGLWWDRDRLRATKSVRCIFCFEINAAGEQTNSGVLLLYKWWPCCEGGDMSGRRGTKTQRHERDDPSVSDPAVLGVTFLGVADRRGPGWVILGLPAWWRRIDRLAATRPAHCADTAWYVCTGV